MLPFVDVDQICSEELQIPERAQEYYQRGIRACPGSIPLWRLAARLAERTVGVNKARSMLELARLRNPKSEWLWLEAVRLERRAGVRKGADSLMAKALQECPGSGVLWAEEILVAQRAEQKSGWSADIATVVCFIMGQERSLVDSCVVKVFDWLVTLYSLGGLKIWDSYVFLFKCGGLWKIES